MNIREKVRGALRRIAGVSLGDAIAAGAAGSSAFNEKRRTVALPSILNTYGFSRTGIAALNILPKPTPANLRRFAETPVARKAINTIKDRIAGMKWRVQARRGRSLEELPDAAARVQALTDTLDQPNPDDSFRSLAEQVLEDVIVGGFGAIEVQVSGDPAKPLVLWPVDGASIRMKADWDGRPDSTRYLQATQQFGPAGQIELNDDELIYIRLNARTHTPFGLGRVEVAFETINAFLSAHRYASRLASNSVVQYALWLKDLTPAHHERLIRWWQDEIEGTGKVPILSVENKPEVLRFGGGTDADLRLAWQEFLLRVMANAFDLPPQFLGVERDVNRSTAAEMNDVAFQHAIVPTARLFAEHITRDAIAKKLGWHDLEFVFTELDAQNEMEQAQIDEILLRSGVMTVNEVRRMRGLAELPVATGAANSVGH
ncbi:MAG: phage portal protein [Acidobacteria bacterium]|jgi:HK97 family phage portal protein|nr:MAG: phage portal protein [Acidobacteriota bacterium]